MTQHLSDTSGHYPVTNPLNEDEILRAAERIIELRFQRKTTLTQPMDAKAFVVAKLALKPNEVFAAIFLDNRHRVLAFETLFTGTIDGCSVHPRVVVQRVLVLNAAAVIFAHVHPSGDPEPSSADKTITRRLVDALNLVDVRVLDHLVVGGTQVVSLAERGQI